MNPSKTEQGIYPPLCMGMQFFNHSQESKAPSGVTMWELSASPWEDKGHRFKGVPPLPPPPDFYIAEHIVI